MPARRHPGARALQYAVRLRVLLKYVGQLWLVLALLTCVPAAVAVAGGEGTIALWYALGAALLASVGWSLARLDAPRRVQRNEALVISGVLFASAPLVMMPAFVASGLTPIDAFFEAVSGVTTTGLTTLATVEGKPASFLFGRAWMQWYGGLGIVVFGVALAVHSGLTAKTLGTSEAEVHDPASGTRVHFRRILQTYGALSVATVVCLWMTGTGVLDGVLYAMSSVSTGGFSPHDASLAALPTAARYVALVACLLCSVSLAFSYDMWRNGLGGLRQRVRDPELHAILLFAAIVAAIVSWAGVHDDGMSWPQALERGVVMGLSAQTTTGFSTVEVGSMSATAKTGLLAAMFVGGGTGSTAGGWKVLRLLVLLALLRRFLARSALPPHAVLTSRLGGRPLDESTIADAMLILGLLLLSAMLSVLPFVAGGHDPLEALFEVVSALGTVGLSAGVSSPQLEPSLKLVLCADMLLGRLEILAWLVIFYPGTWIGRRASI